MPWIYLTVAGILEIIWAASMKESAGFTRLWPSIITLAGMIGSVWLLALAMKSLPLGTAYTIWVGIGAVGAFVVGIVFMGEPATAMRLLAGALIVAGIVLLKLSSV